MGLRLVAAERKSRKSGDEQSQFDRQAARNADRAQRDGHVIVHTTRDVVSSQTMPWQRRNLKAWMTNPDKLAMYDGVLVETDRLARCDDRGWHDIESWCYDHGKRIVTTEGVQFPPRDDSDRYQWLGLKRRARTYWEDVRDKHADSRKIVLANHAALGRPPFGYRVAGEKMHKRFEVDPVTGPLALEVFKRIADGQTATAVGDWLSVQLTIVPFAPPNIRAKRITDMIGSASYLGERDGHRFPMLVDNMPELVDTARAALACRSFDHGGNRVTHAYSSRIYCECGAPLNHHQSTKNGKSVGQAKYRCSRGRRGIANEQRCSYPAWPYDKANADIEAAVGALSDPDGVLVTSGGDAQKQARLDAIAKDIERAVKVRNYAEAARLQADYEQAEAVSDEVTTRLVLTGKTTGQRFLESDLDYRREMLVSGQFKVFLTPDGADVVYLDDDEAAA